MSLYSHQARTLCGVTESSAVTKRQEMDRTQSCALCEGVTAVSTKFPMGQVAQSVGVRSRAQICRCGATSAKCSQEVEVEETFRQLEEALK